jgi:hypothetical protein
MNHEERSGRIYSQFRTSLDFGMGIMYILIASMILTIKYFGTMALDASFAYILGTLMLLYGVFRIYRGFSALRNRKRNAKKDFPDLYNRS